ncbi:hypothetical protein GOEFS_035_00150 [Gordonia effusa NBRC 100432]|uniref:DUF2993 domain-containing protein n=1 Tax=Gordonia effusa NBRC 100432 TaxID=1077974 RepID=H0QXD3_9ACTN|nr:LmeA family phospholipid-binding protein [Gordonia effusa]GAB17484.1 hypothetical protein GOEFS_035_00150 [Gordonia effusa NBRC 100432]
MTDEPRDESADADKSPETTQLPPPVTDPSARAYSQMPKAADDDFVPVGSTASFDTPSEAFGTPPPSGQFEGSPVATEAPAKRHLGKIIGLVSVGVVLLLVIGFASFELYTRHKVKDCISQGVSEFTGSETDVSLSGKPMVLQWISGDIPFVQVDTKDDAHASTKLHMRLDNLSQEGDTSKVGSIAGNGSLSFARVMELSKTGGFGTSSTTTPGDTGISTSNAQISKIEGNSAAGTIKIDSTYVLAFIPIPVSVTMKPEVVDGKISFKVVEANAASIIGIPSDFAQGIVDQVSKSMFDSMFDTVKFTTLKVTDTGVEFAVAGDNVSLKQNVSSPSGSCSGLF